MADTFDPASLFQGFIHNVYDYAVVTLDPRGCITTWNNGAVNMFGYSPEEVLHKDISLLYLPSDVQRGQPEEDFQAATATGSLTYESWRKCKDGHRCYTLFTLTSCVHEQTGKVTGFLLLLRDLTDRMKHDMALRESEKLYRLGIGAATEHAIILLDAKGHIMTWNTGAEKIFGYTANDVIGKCIGLIYSPEDIAADRPQQDLKKALHEGRSYDEGWRVRKGGTCLISMTVITPVRDIDGAVVGFTVIAQDGTERVQAEQAVRENEERLRLLVDGIQDYAISFLDERGIIRSWNVGAQRMRGFAPGEVIGRHFSLFYTQQDILEGKPELALEKARTLGVFREEGWRARKDGTTFFANVCLTALRSPAGALQGYAKITSDVTERVYANNILRESEERFRLLVENVTDVSIFMLDPKGYVRSWNAGAQRIKGYIAEEIIGRHFSVFYSAADLASGRPERELEVAAKTGHYSEEGWRVRKDGTCFLAQVTLQPLYTTEGILRGFAKVTRDVTEITRIQQQLAESEERFRLLVENVRDYAIFMLDPFGNILSWNKGAEVIKGYTTGEVLGRHFSIFYPPEDIGAGRPQAALHLATEQDTVTEQGWRVRKDGSRFMAHSTITALRDKKQGILRGFAKVTRDITESMIANRTAKELMTQLAANEVLQREIEQRKKAEEAAANALRSKSDFLANMSHEIRTPLNAILGFAELLCATDDEMPDSERRQALSSLWSSSEQLMTTITDLLDLPVLQQGQTHLESVDCLLLPLILHPVGRIQKKVAHKGLSVSVRALNMLPEHVVTDPGRVMHVLDILLDNAVKFTFRGSIDVSVKLLVPRSTADDHQVSVEVADTGIGISQDQQAKLFKPFAQVDSSLTRHQGGPGIGLAVAKRLAILLGGSLSVSSTVAVGSKFTFTFACGSLQCTKLVDYTEDQLSPVRQPVPDALPDLTGGRILVVEDVLENQLIVGTLLRRAGAEVELAETGKAAVDMILNASDTPPYDVVLMDMQMPVMDGYEATRLLRASGCGLPIIALTAHALAQDRERCLAAGCSDYAVKPIDRAHLLRLCWRWMQQHKSPLPSMLTAHSSGRTSPSLSPSSMEQSALPVLDRSRLGELEEAAADIVRVFLNELPKRLLALRQALGEKDVKRMESIAHLMKGSAANMGLLALAGACSRLVTAVRRDPSAVKDVAHELLQGIVTESGLAKSALHDFLSK